MTIAKMDLTQHMQDAMSKTIYDYESAIAGLENGARLTTICKKWYTYGVSCYLCYAAKIDDSNVIPNCTACPLNGPVPHGGGDPCQTKTHYVLSGALYETENKEISQAQLLKAFRARLKWIKKRFARNGWEVA